MRQRIHMLTGDRDTGYINTFHGFCANVLKEESFVFNYPKSFLVLDNSDIDAMLSVIYEERNLSLRDMTFSKARDMIEMLKLFERPDYYIDMFDMSLETLKEKYDSAITPKDIIFYGYLYQEKKCFGLDYNDLIIFTLYTFKVNEESRLKWQKRLMYIMIDEFQDIDKPQYDLMEVLSDYHKNLFVVGDPDQTIYTWRGADIHYLLDFDKKFKGTKTIMMNDNYRSVKSVIDVANSLIAKNKYREEKNLVSIRGEGANTAAYFAKNADDEADFIAEKIVEIKEKNNENFKDMTILFRSHFLTRSLENALFTKQIPYVIYSGVQFYDRVEIKVALSYLRMLVSADDLAFKRVINTPKRNMGERRIKFLEEVSENNQTTLFNSLKENIDNPIFKGTKAVEFLELINTLSENFETKSISELLTKVLDLSGYEEALRTEGAQERLDNLAELKQSVYDYEVTCGEETNLDSYLKHIALYTNTDLEDTKDRVKLMTIHAAKGLEFKNVFICGLNEGIFPSKKIRTQVAMEEERRLAFVAITRAKDRLFLTEANGRNFDGSPRFPSRFLFDIEKQYLEYINEPNDALIKETKEYVELSDKLLIKDKSDLLPEGSRVKHMILGEGSIISIDQEMQAYVIKFDSSETERMIAFKVSLELI
jgi:DNA helicase-2/ATP-dependent DNA helicase PcrA